MSEPLVKVLGIYRLDVTDDLVSAQCSVLHSGAETSNLPSEAVREVRDQLFSVVLVEAVVENRDEHFSMDDFAQAQKGVERSHWQAAWAEAFLTLDGTSLVEERWSAAPEFGDIRIAFFMHNWCPSAPLQSSYGECACPPPQPMPPRLAELVPFELVD